MTVCENDPDAISSSLVLKTDREYRINPDGTPMLDEEGNELPPLWRPTALHAADVVDTGDAVDGILSAQLSAGGTAEDLPNGILWRAEQMLNKHFANKDRAFVESHLQAYLGRYIGRRFGLAEGEDGDPSGGDDVPPDRPGTLPEAETAAKHDGCRSTLGYHHLTMCRTCGAEISGCGCDHRELESRVVTMAKDPCPACAAKAAEAEKSPQADDGAQPSPDAQPDPPSDPENPQGVSAIADAHRRRVADLFDLQIGELVS
jgi:hypothetical protein